MSARTLYILPVTRENIKHPCRIRRCRRRGTAAEHSSLLERFAQDDRVRIRNPRHNLQIKFTRPIGNGNEFVAYVDAIGQLDGESSIIDWKTTGARYPDQPEGLLALDRVPGHAPGTIAVYGICETGRQH